MASISKEIAEAEVIRLQKQKQPKMYCVVRYQNRLNGDSVNGTYSGYALCRTLEAYLSVLASPVVGGVDLLWRSTRCEEDLRAQNDDSDFCSCCK